VIRPCPPQRSSAISARAISASCRTTSLAAPLPPRARNAPPQTPSFAAGQVQTHDRCRATPYFICRQRPRLDFPLLSEQTVHFALIASALGHRSLCRACHWLFCAGRACYVEGFVLGVPRGCPADLFSIGLDPCSHRDTLSVPFHFCQSFRSTSVRCQH